MAQSKSNKGKGKGGKAKAAAKPEPTEAQQEAAEAAAEEQAEQAEVAEEQVEQQIGRTTVEEDIALRSPGDLADEQLGEGTEGTVGDDAAVAERGADTPAQGVAITHAEAHAKLGGPAGANDMVMRAPLSPAEAAEQRGEDPAEAHARYVQDLATLTRASGFPVDEYATEDYDGDKAADAVEVGRGDVLDFAVRRGLGESYLVVVLADGQKRVAVID